MSKFQYAYPIVVAICLFGFGGCGGQAHAPEGEAADDHAHEEHAHAEEGPHGGHIIELGHEDYHAELTHEPAPKVTVYFLGGDAKTSKAIAAKSIMINTTEDGQGTQFELVAVPQEGDAEGSASVFEISSEPLHTIVSGESEARGTSARISLTIDDAPYVGIIETEAHDHDHDHGHEH